VSQAAELLLRKNIRLMTFTGPGGSGKTRLALAVATTVSDQFAAGLKFVALASIKQPDLVVSALAEVFDIQQVSGSTVPQLMGDQLQNSGPLLLLLDNFEQVLPAAKLIAEILEVCPFIKILVTSRTCLKIYGEQQFPVTPLNQRSAIELFIQRAEAVRPNFSITSENVTEIGEICSRLDGLPLAIELAAARTRVLSPSEMLIRLQSRLEWLSGGALDLPERQQTLRNTIDWSYSLLNEAERKLFRRLSVFIGGCTVEAAEAACNTSRDLGVDVIEGLSSLMDKNFIQRVDRTNSEARFGMLETIREYAIERLADSGEQSSARRSHAAYCLVVAEEGNPELNPADRSRWLEQCDREMDNFRAALDGLFRARDLDWGLRLCIALFRFWDMREHLTEGRTWLETGLCAAGTDFPNEQAKILHFLGAITTAQGDFAAAEGFLNRSLSMYEELGDEWGIAASLNAQAITARDRGDYVSAKSTFERSLGRWRMLPDRLAIARCLHNLANAVKVLGDYPLAQRSLSEAVDIFEELGDRSGAAWSINLQGDIAHQQGQLAAARELYERALSIFRQTEDQWGCARSLTDLGSIDCERGDHAEAYAAYKESLEIFAGLGHRRGLARALEGVACLALVQGRAYRALKLGGAAANLRRLIGAPLTHAEQSSLDRSLLSAWASLSKPEGKTAWTEGYEMSLDRAIYFSLEELGFANSKEWDQ
jgi:predicted ATPase